VAAGAAVLPKGVPGALQVGRMMMAVPLRQHLDRHAEEARRLPCVDPRLHQTGGCGVPQDVRRHIGAEACIRHRISEGLTDIGDRLPIPFDGKPLSATFPAPQVRQQARRQRTATALTTSTHACACRSCHANMSRNRFSSGIVDAGPCQAAASGFIETLSAHLNAELTA
jgi:hypothetical protein